MTRPYTLFTGQWVDLTLEEVAAHAAGWGYDGLEIAVSGEHLDAWRWDDDDYVASRLEILERHGLKVWAISNHLTGQAVCDDPIDFRHQARGSGATATRPVCARGRRRRCSTPRGSPRSSASTPWSASPGHRSGSTSRCSRRSPAR